ncbi:CrcB family protein [Fretibacter rubidus]|uniref:CrcB family protein n=1 Tax=Fretibacter rubidus TaxID=570162 RepID=UPI00352B8BC5
MNGFIYVAMGGAIGASLRHLLSGAMMRAFGPDKPLGFMSATFCANVLGGFLMGVLVGWLALRVSGGEGLRLFLGVGLLGGFTTFSAFSLEAVNMFERRDYGPLLAYVSGSVLLSCAALLLGFIVARKVFSL